MLLDDFHIAVLTRSFQMVLSAPDFGFCLLNGPFVFILCRGLATVTLNIGQRLFQARLAINVIRCLSAIYLPKKFNAALTATSP